MKIDIKARGFDLEAGLRHFAMCCAAFELGAQRNRIESVQLHLTQAQEPRGSKDQFCLVEVNLSDGNRILTRDEDLDLHVAIYRALERAGLMCALRRSREDADAANLPVARQRVLEPGEPNRAA